MASPSLRVTIAFFQDGRRPAYRPYVRRLARTIMVRTPVTDTLNSDSMAALICGLLASEWTRNAYSLRAPYAADDFSVTTGRTMVLCRSGIVRLLLTGAFVQRADFHDDRLRPENLVCRLLLEKKKNETVRIDPCSASSSVTILSASPSAPRSTVDVRRPDPPEADH